MKSLQVLNIASSKTLTFKLWNATIYNNRICIPQTFVMVKDPTKAIIFGNPVICSLFHIDKIDHNRINM